jgi:CheY-like chemotaxis protein
MLRRKTSCCSSVGVRHAHLALNSFEAGLYDLLLLDIKMSEMDGFELYQKKS